jgi:type I restriction enzyme S subunit
MSSKNLTPATKEEAKPALLPKLRFPEFRGKEGWAPSALASACDMQAGKFVSASCISEGNKEGLFPCYGGNGLRGYTATYTHDGTYPLIGRQGALCGNVRLATGQFHATEHAVVATPKNQVDVGWLYYSLDLLNLNRFATGQAQPGLSVDVLENVPVAIPPTPAEQQKIAECLSSVDELMAAQARKVDSLKTHKKGLMQQLFPREGETQPRLRFPEFQNTGEWEANPLGQLIEIASGQVDPKQLPYCDWPQVGSENIESHSGKLVNVKSAGEKGLISGNYAFNENDILYSKIRPALNKVAAPAFKGICSAEIYPVRPADSRLHRNYLFYLLLSQDFLDYAILNSERGKIPKINRDALLNYTALIPSPAEQQRIATCLSSLDALITAETQKHEALKTHKKGLMQQLFPTPEEPT